MREDSLKGEESKGLTFEKCKQILNKKGQTYSDEEIMIIRQFLYQIAEIDYQIYQYRKRKEKDERGLISR
jgi:hypothetical protein